MSQALILKRKLNKKFKLKTKFLLVIRTKKINLPQKLQLKKLKLQVVKNKKVKTFLKKI